MYLPDKCRVKKVKAVNLIFTLILGLLNSLTVFVKTIRYLLKKAIKSGKQMVN